MRWQRREGFEDDVIGRRLQPGPRSDIIGVVCFTVLQLCSSSFSPYSSVSFAAIAVLDFIAEVS